MDVKKTLEDALAKPMNRKQFLASSGAVVLSLIGVTAALKAISPRPSASSKGYGASNYGGTKES